MHFLLYSSSIKIRRCGVAVAHLNLVAILHWRPAGSGVGVATSGSVAVAVAAAAAPVGPRDIRRAEFNSPWRYHSFLLFLIYHFCGCGVVRTCHMLQIFHGAALLHRNPGPPVAFFFVLCVDSLCLLQSELRESSVTELLGFVPGRSRVVIGGGAANLCFSRPPTWNISRFHYQIR